MAQPFARTQSVLADQTMRGSRILLAAAATLLSAWLIWFFAARVPVYATSETARLEVLRATHPVEAPVAGRVVGVLLTLDAPVSEGQVLVELDATSERLQLAEAQAKANALAPQIAAIHQQIAAEQSALEMYRQELSPRLAEAAGRQQEGRVARAAAKTELERTQRLFAGGSVAEAELLRARAESDTKTAAERSLRANVERTRRESATGEGDRAAHLAALERSAAELEGSLPTLKANIETLKHDIERRVVRAPASGRIGEVGMVRVGSVVAAGERLATTIGGGDLRVIASFEPAAALGRIHSGQLGRIRMDGFPWTEYGTLTATVTEVATELRDGKARIELSVQTSPAPRIPLQHGLPGRAEIEIERVSPATLVLRAAGRLRDHRPTPAASTGGPPPR